MSKNANIKNKNNNNQENIFFKISNVNIKDYIPNNIKQNNIREEIPCVFSDVAERKYPYELYPNCLYEKWPSNDEIKSFDFEISSENVFNDPNNNLLVFPYSLRKDAFNKIIWMRPKEYMKQKKLIKDIKDNFPNKNFNFIKNKFSIASHNILNFNIHKIDEDDDNANDQEPNNKDNKMAKVNNDETESEKENNSLEGLNSLNKLKVDIKKRNSIDVGIAQGEGSNFSNDFINGKLSIKEKNILDEYEKEQKFDFYIVKTELIEDIEEKKDENKLVNKNKNVDKSIETEKKYKFKLIPNNLNLDIGLSEYCRWISSLFQLLIDNNIYTENNSQHFLRRIYPQDENGTPIYNPSGKYWVKLYHMGEERKVEIDDKFPVNKYTFQPLLPQCSSEYELWPLILTKSILKLFSYKYRSDFYEFNEVGDNSILYSLTQYIGIELPLNKFYSFLDQVKSIDNKEENNNNNLDEKELDNSNKIEELTLLKHSNYFNYDLLIGYYKSTNIDLNIPNINNIENKMNDNLSSIINNSYSQKILSLPSIKKNKIYDNNEKVDKIVEKRTFKFQMKRSANRKSINNEIIQRSLISNNFQLDPSRVTDFPFKFNIYNRFNTKEGSKFYSNSQKYLITKTNKSLNNGIICDMGYSVLELFSSHQFNMKRTKPILFDDLKLNIIKKYKQMDPEEKVIYIEKIKELRIKQKKEKKIRINEYLDIGKSIMFIRIYNGSISHRIEVHSPVTSNEIKAAKFCIENNIPFPPEKYFEHSFLDKAHKDEETGEINFWTKNFYHKLLKKYFKDKILKEEENKKNQPNQEEIKDNDQINELENNEEKIENEEDKKNILIEKINSLYEQFNQKLLGLENEFENKCNMPTPGTWMNFEFFLNSFNTFILYKNSLNFKYKLNIDNIYYNYNNDLFEEKESSNIIHLVKEENEQNNIKNENNINPFSEDELYIIFEANGEKNFKSISSGLEYESSKLTINTNKYNDFEYSIILKIYQVTKENESEHYKIDKIKICTMKGYYMCLNLNLSELNNNKERAANEYFIFIRGNKCPFGYHLQLFSNQYSLENYSLNQFMTTYNKYIEKRLNIMHPTLRKYQYYLMAHFAIEYKDESDNGSENKNEKKIVKFYNDIVNYDDNYIKNNIEVILINNCTNKKINLYLKQIIEIDFSICSKYKIEISIRAPQDIPEKKFEFFTLYNNQNINFEICPSIQPFFIREKYVLNKNLNIFNELLFPSEDVVATLEISLEYRPSQKDNKVDNINDQEIPEIKDIDYEIPLNLSLNYGDKNIFKKYFINNTIIRNLSLKGKLVNTKEKDKNKSKDKEKDKDAKNINENVNIETYILECSLDPDHCPEYLKNISLYKNDIYWKIIVFSTDPICFVKNTMKEDKETAIKEEWEINEPGRALKASISRKKYFLNVKAKNGELLTPEEEELINLNSHTKKETIESNSNMMVTNIPPKSKNKSIEKSPKKNKNKDKNKDKEKEKDKNEIENGNNLHTIERNIFSFHESNNNIDILKRLPKIKNYYSLVMKNFYSYSKQNRIITKNTRGNNLLSINCNSISNYNEKMRSLPDIYCRTPEEKNKYIKQIEDDYDQFNNIKLEEKNKTSNNKLIYDKEVKTFMTKLLNKRFKIKNVTQSNDTKLLKIIKLNNIKLEKIKVIQKLNEDIIKCIYSKENENENEKEKGDNHEHHEKEKHKDKDKETHNDELFLKWYDSYKSIIKNSAEIIDKEKKVKNIINNIKNNLTMFIEKKFEEHKNSRKKDKKFIKKYIDIINEKILDYNILSKVVKNIK